MIGGGMILLFFMPDWMKSISIVSPIRWSVLAFEGGIWRDSSLAEMATPLGVLVGIGVVGFVAGAAILGRSRFDMTHAADRGEPSHFNQVDRHQVPKPANQGVEEAEQVGDRDATERRAREVKVGRWEQGTAVRLYRTARTTRRGTRRDRTR